MTGTRSSTAARSGGFALPLDGNEVRRQLHLSLGVVTMLAIGIVSAGVVAGGHPLAVKRDVIASRTPVTAMQAEVKVTGAKPI